MTRIETYLLLTWNIIVLNSNHNKHISPQMTDPIRREKIKKRGGGIPNKWTQETVVTVLMSDKTDLYMTTTEKSEGTL